MKQTLTVKVLVVSAIALAAASGCERRTRPPAKPDVTSDAGGGNNIAGKGSPAPVIPGATAAPEASPVASPVATASPAPQTDDQKAADLDAKLTKYMADAKEAIDKKTGYISFVESKDAADKLTISIDPKAAETFYTSQKALLLTDDAATLVKYKRADGEHPTADDIIKAMVNGLEGKDPASLKSVMEKFKADLSAIKPTVEANVTSQKADLERVEAILKSIDDAVKQISSLK